MLAISSSIFIALHGCDMEIVLFTLGNQSVRKDANGDQAEADEREIDSTELTHGIFLEGCMQENKKNHSQEHHHKSYNKYVSCSVGL